MQIGDENFSAETLNLGDDEVHVWRVDLNAPAATPTASASSTASTAASTAALIQEEVQQLANQGLSANQIASNLNVSVSTVEIYLSAA